MKAAALLVFAFIICSNYIICGKDLANFEVFALLILYMNVFLKHSDENN